jgi:hypothetical protein
MQLFNKLKEISKILHIIYIYIIYQYVVDSTSFKKHSDVFCHVLSHATATVYRDEEWMGCWGLLGLLIVRQWIIPEDSLISAQVSM